MCSAFMVNEYSWFEHCSAHGRYYGNIAVFGELKGISKRTAFLKVELAKYDIKASLGSKHILFSYFIITELTGLKLS